MTTSEPVNITVYRGTTLGPIILECKDAEGNAVDLTDYTPFAQVRKKAGASSIIIDLAPVFNNGTGSDGKVKITKTDEETLEFTVGQYAWDFMLQNPAGERLGPYVEGSFNVRNPVTLPA